LVRDVTTDLDELLLEAVDHVLLLLDNLRLKKFIYNPSQF
jgi:hypothetical protein